MTQYVTATFVVSDGAHDFRLFFSDFPANEVRNPDNVGLYALAVERWSPDRESPCTDTDLGRWSCAMSVDGSTEMATRVSTSRDERLVVVSV